MKNFKLSTFIDNTVVECGTSHHSSKNKATNSDPRWCGEGAIFQGAASSTAETFQRVTRPKVESLLPTFIEIHLTSLFPDLGMLPLHIFPKNVGVLKLFSCLRVRMMLQQVLLVKALIFRYLIMLRVTPSTTRRKSEVHKCYS